MPTPRQPPPTPRALQRRRQIGNRIRAARLYAGLTQEGLAERTGLSRQTTYRVELGIIPARIDWLVYIADALEVPLAELVIEEEG